MYHLLYPPKAKDFFPRFIANSSMEAKQIPEQITTVMTNTGMEGAFARFISVGPTAIGSNNPSIMESIFSQNAMIFTFNALWQ